MNPSNWKDCTTFAMRKVSLAIALLQILHDALPDFAYSTFQPLGGAGAAIGTRHTQNFPNPTLQESLFQTTITKSIARIRSSEAKSRSDITTPNQTPQNSNFHPKPCDSQLPITMTLIPLYKPTPSSPLPRNKISPILDAIS